LFKEGKDHNLCFNPNCSIKGRWKRKKIACKICSREALEKYCDFNKNAHSIILLRFLIPGVNLLI
jgi:hypothetical protein